MQHRTCVQTNNLYTGYTGSKGGGHYKHVQYVVQWFGFTLGGVVWNLWNLLHLHKLDST